MYILPLIFNKLIAIILINFPSLSSETYEYSPEEVFDYFSKQKLTQIEYEEMINLIIQTLQDIYPFYEISKNPPQPQYYNTYFTPVDIEQRLRQINITNITKYEFYQNVTKILSDLKDPLILINWNNTNIDEFYFFEPLDFYIKEVDGKPKIFGKCNINRSIMKYFKEGNKIYELSLRLANVSISNINGTESPNYIEIFGENYQSTKNPHSTFNLKIRNHNKLSMKYYPLKFKDFKDFRFIYENGEIITADYIFLSQYQIYEDEEPMTNPTFNLNLRDIKKNNNSIINNLPWNYSYEDYFKCLVDDENEKNIYYIHSFLNEDYNKYINTIINCYKLIDNNTYPIIVINDNINSKDYQISQLLLNIISPLLSFNIYGALKIKNNFTETNDINNHIKHFGDINNCSSINYSYLISGKKEINYSFNNKINLSQPFVIKKNKSITLEIEKAKKYMKNKRKPNEILLLTDGSSLSGASIMIKYLQKSGGAIVAGYMGNPLRDNIYVFDSSASPSIYFSSEEINYYSEAHRKLGEKYGFKFESLPGIQTFFDYNINNIPLEYELNPVDELIKIYEIFNISNYQKFINESKKIFEKYKKYCNSKHNLILVSELCDRQFENEYTHGGFQCGNNGKWSNICVPFYCDQGYIFDYTLKKCIEDLCLNITEEEKEIEEEEIEEEEIEEEEEEKENEEEEEIKEDEEEKIKQEEEEKNIDQDKKNEEEDKINLMNLFWTNIIIVLIASFILVCVGIIICFKSNYCCFNKKKKNKEHKNIINNKNSGLFQNIID